MTDPRPTRPLLRYLGGKWRLAPWIIRHFPPHRVYVEPFGGAANVLLRKPRAQTEVYNDLDDDLVNLFRVLRAPAQAAALQSLLRLTPFARSEFLAAYELSDDPVERARRLIVRSFMGHSACGVRLDRKVGFRPVNDAAHGDPARTWSNYPEALGILIDRLAGVSVECRPARALLADRDASDVLFYVDPPYVHATRSQKMTRGAIGNGYRHELSDDDHVALLDQLIGLKGMVVLSGYANPIYAEALHAWCRFDRASLADGGRPRIESLWLNGAASAALGRTDAVRGEAA